MKRIHMLLAVVVALLLGLASSTPGTAGAAPPTTVNRALYSGLKWRNVGPQLGGRSIAVAGSSAVPRTAALTGSGCCTSTTRPVRWTWRTDQTSQVFDGLNTLLQTHLGNLRTTVGTDVPAFNNLIATHNQTPIDCSAV